MNVDEYLPSKQLRAPLHAFLTKSCFPRGKEGGEFALPSPQYAWRLHSFALLVYRLTSTKINEDFF